MRVWEYYYKEQEEIRKITITDKPLDQNIQYKNRLINNPICINTGGGDAGLGDFVAGDTSTWMNCVKEMAKWYVSTGTHYVNAVCMPPCPLIGNSKTQPDCSGFVTACLSLFAKLNKYHHETTHTMAPGKGKGYDWILSLGFKHRRLSDADGRAMADPSKRWTILQPGDIVRHSADGYPRGTGRENENGHTYIIGENRLRYEMGGKNGRSVACSIPYNDYVDRSAASGKYYNYDIFRL